MGTLICLLSLLGYSLATQMTLCEYWSKLGVHKPECHGSTGTNMKSTVFRKQNNFQPTKLPPIGDNFNNFNNLNKNTQFQQPNNNFVTFQGTVFSQLLAGNGGNLNNFNNNNIINNNNGNNFGVSIAPTFGQSLPLCRNYFHSCMASSLCESGQICSNGLGRGSCCTNPNRAKCNTDGDCRGHSTTASLCCPTGCNYNMCVHVGPQITMERRNIVFSSLMGEVQCPDPYRLNVKCLVGKPTNHCYTNAECLSGVYPRRCCATLCGYNVCAMNMNGKWIVA
ncbi:hypothetical protein WR25_17354 [Diploscapter pachys]|uniref:WAP domain-containing protein n=1 Tax=Diploscapter pachys TaxID=2018661 RepID=A0A2A2JNA3_9BILA|nr:hypothetical protein WR25_17354 [Diploscapter pachys]